MQISRKLKQSLIERLKIALKHDTIYYNDPLRGMHNKSRYIQQDVIDWAHYVHKHHIILARAFNFHQPWDREIVTFYHPFQWANIYKVADAISSDKVLLIDPKDHDEESPNPKKQLQNKWDRNHGQLLLRKAVEKGRKHGWVLYVPLQQKYIPKYNNAPPWRLYSADEAQAVEWDAQGFPIKWLVQPTNKHVDSFELSITQCVFFDIYQTDDHDGIPEGSQIWDELIDYIFSKEAWASFNQRMGNGFMILPVPLGTPDSVKSSYQDKIMNIRTEMGLIWEVDDQDGGLGNQKPDWMSPQGTADFINHLEKLEDAIATGMGFPKRWLRGDSEGAMESSAKDKLQVHSKLQAVFNQWKRFVILVCLHHQWIADFGNIEVRPGFKMEQSDEEKANIDLLKTESVMSKAPICTINELRAMLGLEKMDDPKADQLMEEGGYEEGGGGSSNVNESRQTQVKASDYKNDTFNLEDLILNHPRQAAAHLKIAPNTAYKLSDSLKEMKRPKVKFDSLEVKQDSINWLDDRTFEVDVTLLKPQRKYYSQYKAHCITPKEEIERIFKDPTYPHQYRIGVTSNDDHASKIPSEVLEENAIGVARWDRIENNEIKGKAIYNLDKIEKVLGPGNWIEEKAQKGEFIPMSVARWTQDLPFGKDLMETNLDIRSYVATRKPRNEDIGGK